MSPPPPGTRLTLIFQDPSEYSETLFPGLIAGLPRGMTLWAGLDDMLLLANGTRITIQNLTWAGAQGFQTPITEPIVFGNKTRGACGLRSHGARELLTRGGRGAALRARIQLL